MKGRSNRLPPSAPLEDWGDGQWTVDCSCGVNFDDGEEMVSCDECGVWVHTRCSHYVRGEASFACHKCTPTSKGTRAVVTSAANNFTHDAEETEVAKLLIELPTKTDRPPPIPPGGAPYRPPFRLWAQVPKEERVHMQGVPGGDPSLFRGLSSKIASPDLWKCTGYVPKKFNFKYKEFPCWEEEERDKASLGADALFSLSKETVQAVPVKSSEKILSPGGTRRKDGQNLPLGSRSFGCVKKERNKLRVAGSSKCRKGEADEKDFSGRKKSQGDSDRLLANSKNKDETVAVFDSRKEDLSEDGRLHIAESDVPDTNSTHKRENIPLPKPSCKNLDERLNNGSKSKHMVVFKTSKKHLSDEVPRSKLSLETLVKAEKVNRLDGRVSCKLNTTVTSHVDDRNTAKSFIKQEDAVKPALSFKEPKDENHSHAVPTEVITGTIMNSNFFNHGSQPDVTDVTLVPSSSASCSVSAKKAEINLKIETLNDQAIENLNFPRHNSAGKQYVKDDLPQSLIKANAYSSITLDESKMKTSIQYEEQKPEALLKDSDLSQSFQECIKSNRADPSHSSSHPEKVAATGKEFLKPTPLVGSNSSICSNQNSAAKAASGKNFHVVKQHSVKVTNSFKPAEDKKEQEVSPTGSEFSGSKSLQTGKTSQLLAKNHSLDLKGQPSGPSFQASAGNPATSSGIAVATASPVQSPSNQLKAAASGSFQKIDKTTQPNSQPASKFLGHSLVMQASTLTNSAATLSDEELALLLHQELNSSPRVPRVPRMRQVASSPFSTPSSTSMLSKRSCSGGRDQVSFFRRKHKDASKDGSRHSRDRGAGTAESRRMSRHSPEPNQDESAIFSGGFAKRRKGSKPPNTVPSLRTNASGAPIEDATSLTPLTKEENNARASPANVDADASLVGRSLPCLIDEIVCKGKCSTYEELCDAVRPYWHSLRKPNGERYAYSSHSQAVLDCLRNRTEWAHLIDRGPKTTTSKRRRKQDSETPVMELEHEISGNPLKEDVPKGKRNVRKRRLVGLKEAANKCYQGTLSDENDNDDDDDGDDDDDLSAQYRLSNEETGCHLSDGSGAEEPSSSSGDSD